MLRWPPENRIFAALIGIAVVLQLPLLHWLVEDSAISFAYAENIARGHGAVPFPGGERVEGYSNPLWVALWVPLRWLWVNPFLAKAVTGLGMGVGAVFVVHAWARQLPTGRPEVTALTAAAVVAVSSPHAIWSQGGLENPLFNLLLALLGWRVCAVRHDRWVPWLALGVALTRPEGVLYAAVAAGVSVITADSLRDGARWIGRWATTFLVPFAGYHAVRYAYFAYPFPATYYAKVGERSFVGLNWERSGWSQLRTFVEHGLLAPLVCLLPLGATGVSRSIRTGAALAVAGVLAMAMVPLEGIPTVRAGALAASFTVLPLLALADRSRRGPLLAGAWLWCALFFYLRGNGDWMDGYRFVSMMVIPAAVLLGSAAGDLAAALGTRFSVPRLRVWPFAAAAALLLVGQVALWVDFLDGVETTPYGVKTRLDRYHQLADQLDLPHAVVGDHDMGAMMWWWTPTLTIRDIRGLVDMPFAIHGNRPKVTDHELRDRTPLDFASPHMAAERAMKRRPWYKREFIDVPGWPIGKLRRHGHLKVRRRHVLGPPDPNATPVVTFESDDEGAAHAVLHGLTVDSPEVRAGRPLSLALAVGLPRLDDARVVVFMHQEGSLAASWDIPLAQGWVAPEDWRPGEVSHGRHTLPVPKDVALGEYTLGIAVFDASGIALPAFPRRGAAEPEHPALSEHEAWLDVPVRIVDLATHATLTALDVAHTHQLATDGDCHEAEAAWDRARHHIPRDRPTLAQLRPDAADAMAACWAKRARGSLKGPMLHERVSDLRRGRQWNPLSEPVERASHKVAAKAWHRGLAARRTEDHAAAFEWFTACVDADPSRAWARRYAEEARSALLPPRKKK